MQKTRQKKTANTKQKNAKAKTRTFLIAFVLLFDCIFLHVLCIFVAFVVPFLCMFFIVGAFFCICLVDKCVLFRIFWRFFWHSKASFGDLFLRFLCIFFGIGFALCLHCLCMFFFAVSSELALAYIISHASC